ncbi:S1C family serine protease [Streptomyces sp. DSM 40484]|uniref:S1C family serine protease n=1 Tax=Streptomyces kroppenstedtii TaxID=3051181 RepID=UPI0028D87850|nr:trypsin-like peptidase domain-containing protein [Streptomyces sp. DSM 40484]
MDEGKPTKPKWWSRPRTHGPDPAPADSVPTGDGASGSHGGDTDGDFELEKPAGSSTDTGTGGTAVGAGDGVSAPAPGERPRPLHDPDPYSTPPYGGPGPWAPAPPVQHPGATPDRAAARDAPGQAASGAPAPHGAVSSAPQASVPPADVSYTPVPEASGPHGAASQAAGPPAPASHIPGQPSTVSSAPDAGGPRAFGSDATVSSVSAPHAGASGGPGSVAGGEGAAVGAGHGAAGNGNPWQNYDPWAAAPFQQHGAAAGAPGRRRGRTGRALVLGAALLALVSGGVGGAVGAYLERTGGIDDVELPQAGVEAKGRAPDSVAGIAASALPSVVTLHVSGSEAQGTGTGFVLDRRGHILTNNHVVEPADGSGGITVTFSGGETAKAEVVGHDSGYDLAVVKVAHVSGLKPLSLGNSDNVQVGDPVVAIGAPFDLENTVTAGIISAKERPITAGGEEGDGSDISYVDALQTDAPINPGNSGGPLVDSKARVIGINSAIRSADSGSDLEGGQSGSIGLGFAIPINQGRRVAEELINTGRATHPVIGVTLDMEYSGDGARVGTKGNDGGSAVTRGGPGARAGIKTGDVITEVDGQRVHSGEELIVKTRSHRPGDRLELTLERDGKERKITLVLGSADGN